MLGSFFMWTSWEILFVLSMITCLFFFVTYSVEYLCKTYFKQNKQKVSLQSFSPHKCCVLLCLFCMKHCCSLTSFSVMSSYNPIHAFLFVCSPQHCSKSESTSWLWLLRSSVIIANKPWPRISLTMTTTALILIMAVFNMVSFHVQGATLGEEQH